MKAALFSFALLLLVARAATAFNPPRASDGPLTVEIGDFPSVRQLDVPLPLDITLSNNSERPLAGRLRIAVADEWRVTGEAAEAFEILPLASAKFHRDIVVGTGVHAALYPIHAYVETDDPKLSAHAVAIVQVLAEALPPAPAPPLPVLRPDPGSRTALERQVIADVWIQLEGKEPTRLPRATWYDHQTGSTLSRRTVDRGMLLPSIAQHEPWRTGPGVIWSDYRVRVPDMEPVSVHFYTAIRDLLPGEPPSDGVEYKVIVIDEQGQAREVFRRFSDSRKWEEGSADISAYAGKTITLRLWVGPGPAGDTTCDESYWGQPTIIVGTPAEPADTFNERASAALERARSAREGAAGDFAWILTDRGDSVGAALGAGPLGLADSVLAFAGEKGELTLRGLHVEIDGMGVGDPRSGLKANTTATWQSGEALFRGSLPGPGEFQVRVFADGPALRIAFSMPGVARDRRGTPRFTGLSVGPGSQTARRVYAGFGNVIQYPEAFELHQGGFHLSTRHVGADYEGGLSLLQASDIYPDLFRVRPAEKLYQLITRHDATISLIPSSRGAFAAARMYREHIAGFTPAPGVPHFTGAMCLDNWAPGYAQDAVAIRTAAAYGLTDAVYVKHNWQRFGYDYRLPDILPPAGSLEAFQELARACGDTGINFVPHDNYIDFYPDAEGYSYDHILFNEDGTPQLAWWNPGREAQSYRWNPNSFKPFLLRNRDLMKSLVTPGGIFVDVFSAIPPLDFHNRSGDFFTREVTAERWGECFDLFREGFGTDSVMISEAGCDSLIGHLDAGQSDHGAAFGRGMIDWKLSGEAAERVPWHDMASHGSFILFAGGLGGRYHGDRDPEVHGYGSDDYLSMTVLGGRSPMCEGPFNRKAVMTYWLLHDVCKELGRRPMLAHEFLQDDIHIQRVVFGGGGEVTANRGSADHKTGGDTLPPYGFIARCGDSYADVSIRDGVATAFSSSPNAIFVDARSQGYERNTIGPAEAAIETLEDVGERTVEITLRWTFHEPVPTELVPFLHFDKPGMLETIAFQGGVTRTDAWTSGGTETAKVVVQTPDDLPDGSYPIRLGLWDPATGERVALRGPLDPRGRVRLGLLKVSDGTASLEAEPLNTRPGLNAQKRMVDFGPAATNGAFRLTGSGKVRTVMPLPGSEEFQVRLPLLEGNTACSAVTTDLQGKQIKELAVRTAGGTAEFTVPTDTAAVHVTFR